MEPPSETVRMVRPKGRLSVTRRLLTVWELEFVRTML
jgi:hypothetical protein